MEMPCPEKDSFAYRIPHDFSIKYFFTDLYPEFEPPEIIKAPNSYAETLEMLRKIDPVLVIPGSDDDIILAIRQSMTEVCSTSRQA